MKKIKNTAVFAAVLVMLTVFFIPAGAFENETISFQLPEGFSEYESQGLDGLWRNDELGATFAYLTQDNTEKVALASFRENDLKQFSQSVAELMSDTLQNCTLKDYSFYSLNGFDGVNINITYTVEDTPITCSIYTFSTADKVINLYGYYLDEDSEAAVASVLETVKINGTAYESAKGSLAYSIVKGAVIGAAVGGIVAVLIQGYKKKTKKHSKEEN